MSPMMMWVMGSAMAGPPVVADMHERYDALSAVRDATIRGDLEGAKMAARDLADMSDLSKMPRRYDPWVERMSAHATLLVESEDLLHAALQVGQAASTCGGCHADARGGPQVSNLSDVPPQQWNPGSNMALHAWAVEWMWLGLVARDDATWERGASELVTRPLKERFAGDPEGSKPQLEQLVYVLAERALEADGEVEKATIMGQLVATCSECHTRNAPPQPEPEPKPEPEEQP